MSNFTEPLIKLADCRAYRTAVRGSSIGNLTVVATCASFYSLYNSRVIFVTNSFRWHI